LTLVSITTFVKRLDAIPHLDLLSLELGTKALIPFETTLDRTFTGMWPSPKAVDTWVVAKQWAPKLMDRYLHLPVSKGIASFFSKQGRVGFDIQI